MKTPNNLGTEIQREGAVESDIGGYFYLSPTGHVEGYLSSFVYSFDSKDALAPRGPTFVEQTK